MATLPTKLEDILPRPNICSYCNTQVNWVTQLDGKPICLECWKKNVKVIPKDCGCRTHANPKMCRCGHHSNDHNCFNIACTKCGCGWF